MLQSSYVHIFHEVVESLRRERGGRGEGEGRESTARATGDYGMKYLIFSFLSWATPLRSHYHGGAKGVVETSKGRKVMEER